MLRSHFGLCTIFLCSFFVLGLLSATEDERLALEALYDSTKGSMGWWSNSLNWTVGDPCTNGWFGVSCGSGDGVTEIDLRENGLFGTLPPEMTDLRNLQSLILFSNKISGPLSSSWSSLSSLEVLNLSYNSVSGSLPSEWSAMSNLRIIDLESNRVSGTIPALWNNLTNLQIIDLRGNSFKGILPPEWSALNNLEELSLGGNKITGILPPEWKTLEELRIFEIQENKIDGVFPSVWASLTKLERFIASSNSISGTLPPEWTSLGSLSEMDLSSNYIEGSFPSSWLTLSSKMFVNDNDLTDYLPATPPTWDEFDLRENQFYCPLPVWCIRDDVNFCGSNNADCISPSASASISQSITETPTRSTSVGSPPSESGSMSQSAPRTVGGISNGPSVSVSSGIEPTRTPSKSHSRSKSASPTPQTPTATRSRLQSELLLGPTQPPLPSGFLISPVILPTFSGFETLTSIPRASIVYEFPTEGGTIPIGNTPVALKPGTMDPGVSMSIDTGTGLPVFVNVEFPELYPTDSRIISSVVDITTNGGIQTFSARLCFSPDAKAQPGSCLGYYDESEQEWVCEDPCLEENEHGQLCGRTNHFTSFAILLRGSGGGFDECGSPIFDHITGSWEGDLILSFVLVGAAILFGILVVLLSKSRFCAPYVYGYEGLRISTVRDKHKSWRRSPEIDFHFGDSG